jgi:hypothetical protein
MKLQLAKKRLDRKVFWMDMLEQAQNRLEGRNKNHKLFKNNGLFNLEKESLKDISNAKRLITFCIERYNNVECINL